MELVNRINGFGQVLLTASEQRMLEELSEIASTTGKSYILGEMNEQTGRYERIMQDLFPMVPLVKGEGLGEGSGIQHKNSYLLEVIPPGNCWYSELPEAPELRIGSGLFIGKESKGVDLRVLMPPNAGREGYFMSVVVGDYRRGCIDDIVAKLGEREKPVILGVQPIKSKPPVNPNYGIAEVPQLKTVLKLYERVDGLLRQVGDIIKITSEELHTLRKDMMKHENIAIRRLSAIEYQKALEALIHQ